jgi:hypothetical protein
MECPPEGADLRSTNPPEHSDEEARALRQEACLELLAGSWPGREQCDRGCERETDVQSCSTSGQQTGESSNENTKCRKEREIE